MTIRLVATDVDDTLLNSAMQVPESARSMMERLRQAGVTVTIATGRMHYSAALIAQELEMDVPIISYNGAMIRKGLSGEILHHTPMTKEQVDMVCSLNLKEDLAVHFYIDDVLYVRSLHPLSKNYIKNTRCPHQVVADIYSLVQEKGCPTKILLAGEPDVLEKLWHQGEAQFPGKLYITKSHSHFLEFLNPLASKGAGVKKLGETLGISKAEILVIGDNWNDRELFTAGGVKIAMGNAVAPLKEMATWVAPTHDEDGWAKAMAKWVFQEEIS